MKPDNGASDPLSRQINSPNPPSKIPPLKVRCSFFTWLIKFVKLTDGNHGYTDKVRKEIKIDKSDPPQVQRETLMHELLHVAFEDCSIIKQLDKEFEGDLEEELIRYISPRLAHTLENDEVRAFIWHKKDIKDQT